MYMLYKIRWMNPTKHVTKHTPFNINSMNVFFKWKTHSHHFGQHIPSNLKNTFPDLCTIRSFPTHHILCSMYRRRLDFGCTLLRQSSGSRHSKNKKNKKKEGVGGNMSQYIVAQWIDIMSFGRHNKNDFVAQNQLSEALTSHKQNLSLSCKTSFDNDLTIKTHLQEEAFCWPREDDLDQAGKSIKACVECEQKRVFQSEAFAHCLIHVSTARFIHSLDIPVMFKNAFLGLLHNTFVQPKHILRSM